MAGEGLEDILAAGLSVVFCGINPGLLAAAYSALTGQKVVAPASKI